MRCFRLILILAVVALSRTAAATDFPITNYGAICDTKATLSATLIQNSPIITAPSGTWSGGDAGKRIWCIPQGTGLVGNVSIPATATIASVDSSSQIHASVNATQTGASQIGAFCAWTTQDDTSAFTAAFTAACAASNVSLLGTGPGRIVMPAGGCAVSGRIYNNNPTGCNVYGPSFVGAGQISSTIFLMPSFTIPVDGHGMLIEDVGFGARFADFGFTMLNWGAPMASNQDVIEFTQTTKLDVENVYGFFMSAGLTSFGTSAIAFRGCTNGTSVRGMRVNDAAPGSPITACHLVATQGSFYSSVCSNMSTNLIVEQNQGRDSLTAPLNWFGGIIDEPGMTITNGGQINMIGAVIFGNDGFTLMPGIAISGNSRLWITDSNVGRFNSQLNTGGYAATIEAGSVIYSRGTTWRGNTGGNTNSKAILNNGTLIDQGGNEYWLCGPTTACTKKSAAQLVGGHQPVR